MEILFLKCCLNNMKAVSNSGGGLLFKQAQTQKSPFGDFAQSLRECNFLVDNTGLEPVTSTMSM